LGKLRILDYEGERMIMLRQKENRRIYELVGKHIN